MVPAAFLAAFEHGYRAGAEIGPVEGDRSGVPGDVQRFPEQIAALQVGKADRR